MEWGQKVYAHTPPSLQIKINAKCLGSRMKHTEGAMHTLCKWVCCSMCTRIQGWRRAAPCSPCSTLYNLIYRPLSNTLHDLHCERQTLQLCTLRHQSSHCRFSPSNSSKKKKKKSWNHKHFHGPQLRVLPITINTHMMFLYNSAADGMGKKKKA